MRTSQRQSTGSLPGRDQRVRALMNAFGAAFACRPPHRW
jgi:hypothetical protein